MLRLTPPRSPRCDFEGGHLVLIVSPSCEQVSLRRDPATFWFVRGSRSASPCGNSSVLEHLVWKCGPWGPARTAATASATRAAICNSVIIAPGWRLHPRWGRHTIIASVSNPSLQRTLWPLSCQVLRGQTRSIEGFRLSTWPAKGRAAERTR